MATLLGSQHAISTHGRCWAFGDIVETRLTDQVHWGDEYSPHYPFEHIHRHFRLSWITEGAEEIQLQKVGTYTFWICRPKEKGSEIC
jgi:alkylation response protein AidB-like acyl-CoA dehydrogenase